MVDDINGNDDGDDDGDNDDEDDDDVVAVDYDDIYDDGDP